MRRAIVVVGVISAVSGLLVGCGGSNETASNPTNTVKVPYAEGFRPAVLPLASLAYPSGWFLLDLFEEGRTDQGPVLQLTNFDTALEVIDCQGADLPPNGVLLLISETGPAASDTPTWPVSLTPQEPVTASGCPGPLGATWQSSAGTGYAAHAFVGDRASPPDRRALSTTFDSLRFPERPPTELFVLGGAPRLVLDTGMSGGDLVALVAFSDGDGLGLGVSGPVHSANSDTLSIYGSSIGVRTEKSPSNPADMTFDGGGAMPFSVAYGTVQPGVDRLDIVNDAGQRFPATVVSFPASLGATVRAAWAFVQGPMTVANAVPYNAQGKELGANSYPTAPADILATGEDPTGGPWELSVAHRNIGDGLGFAWTSRGESGDVCCFSIFSDPRRHPLQFTESSTGNPGYIEAIVSADAASIAFHSAGQTTDGLLVHLPSEYLGPAQVALVFVPVSGLVGDLVSYDAQGAEIASLFFGGPERFVPSPEIGQVWESLARARDTISAYGSEHPLKALDAATLSGLEPYVQWSLGATVAPGQVTVGIDSTSPDIGGDVLLRAATGSGDTYCVAVLIDENAAPDGWGGAGTSHPVTVRYGHGDVTKVGSCRGGWD